MLRPHRITTLLSGMTLSLALAGCGAPAATTTAPTASAVATMAPAQPTAAAPTAMPTTAATAMPTAPATAMPTAAATAMPTAAAMATAEPMATAHVAGTLSSNDQLGAETQSLVTAALEYSRKQYNVTADELLRVEIQGVDGNYARVIVVPELSLQLDPSTVFLKRAGDTWQGVVSGTAFPPDDLNQLKIPARLHTFQSDAMYDPKNDAVPSDDYLLGVVSDRVLQAGAKEGRKALGLADSVVVSADIIGIDGDYARVFVNPPADVNSDPTTIFLKRSGSTWSSVVSGTAFTPDNLHQLGVPASLVREAIGG